MEADISTLQRTGHFYFALTILNPELPSKRRWPRMQLHESRQFQLNLGHAQMNRPRCSFCQPFLVALR